MTPTPIITVATIIDCLPRPFREIWPLLGAVSALALNLHVELKVYGQSMSSYRISQLAERCGVPASPLRFYEGAGLLPAERTAAGYRIYGGEAVRRLEFIASAKHLGLPLEEIRELLQVWQDDVCSAVRAQMLPLVRGRMDEAVGRVADASPPRTLQPSRSRWCWS